VTAPADIAPLRMSLTLNRETREVVVEPRTTLLQALREGCRLRGVMAGCGDGSCGTCTVLVDGEPVRACLMLALQAHGADVETVEGLADEEGLAPLQAAFVKAGAPQCGFCIPGFLMLAEGALRQEPRLDAAAIDILLAGNTCRCGAQEPIRAAIAAVAVQRSRDTA